MAFEYSPIVLDSVNHDDFPQVDLFVKNENKYTLYNSAETKLTDEDIERLRENGTEFVYISSANSELVQAYIEKKFTSIQSINSLSQLSKNLIGSQIIINCINDVYKNPTMAVAFHKCRIILRQINLHFKDRAEIIGFFNKLERNFEKYLITHSAQVTILSMYVYEKLFSAGKNELVEIGVGAMLHDIGMLNIADNIMGKTDVLTESEYHRVKLHPKFGSTILQNVGLNDQIPLDVTLNHHERHDGSGYPRGLNGSRIPRHAMLVSICDIYCALTMNRPYKRASSSQEALETLKSEKRLFDPEILGGFLAVMSNTSPPEKVATEKSSLNSAAVKSFESKIIQELRKQMRNSINDRNKLLQIHSLLTDNIKNTFGDEKTDLISLRAELKDLLNSMHTADRQK